MEYPTLQGKLLMRDYGRNVQHMIEHAITIQDREERERCVAAIINTMQSFFPYLRQEESRHVVYDHLAIMSDFKLDIDWPNGMPHPEELHLHPEPLPYNTTPIRMRHYGRIIQDMVAEAVNEPDIDRKHFLINRLANKLKQQYLIWNKDQVEPERIIEDIYLLSDGQLSCGFDGFVLKHGWQLVPKDLKQAQATTQHKKKKK
ncbi:MAG: DUF4290 domain-containing protein [Paludibacteraceae bacterium]|nr:DUF4290 domain-containing protein [Paludibacteraceae bacterium]